MRDFVIISGYHDYRSKRRANLHFIADNLRGRGSVFFLSIRFSELTRFKEDPRHDLRRRSNRIEIESGVECFLWRTMLHPFGLPSQLESVEQILYEFYANNLPLLVRQIVQGSSTILVESGIGITLLPLLRKLSPDANIIYMASDGLTTISQSATVRKGLMHAAHTLTSARLPSHYLTNDLPPDVASYYIPHGIDKQQFRESTSSPYLSNTINAVSVGSMLFDRSFFELASPMFPDVNFYVIGSGEEPGQHDNTFYLPEMPFSTTLPYLTHANFAIAPYRLGAPRYLTHTSMKLTQYNYLRKPAVCPFDVTGVGMGRFGYSPGDRNSIRLAVQSALDAREVASNTHLTWGEVTDRVLNPTGYPDTNLEININLDTLFPHSHRDGE